ncbi:MAG: helix-turn-helix domain-containing protein [Synergistaceae bacterium]|nr:helix-turn-helix domain-containing protein [Synergistaceae bacterium]
MSKLRDVRRMKGLKACELARIVGVHASNFSMAENRKYVLGADARIKIAELLELPETKLFNSSGLARP